MIYNESTMMAGLLKTSAKELADTFELGRIEGINECIAMLNEMPIWINGMPVTPKIASGKIKRKLLNREANKS